VSTTNKDFRVKNGLVVEGSVATVNGNNVLTTASSINSLQDVDLTNIQESDILVYTSGIFYPEPLSNLKGDPGIVAQTEAPIDTDILWLDTDENAYAAVNQIVAGTNITITPTDGTGIVTINASGGGGGGSTPLAVSSNISLSASYSYFVDTTAARTLTLPATPSLGDSLEIFDAVGTAHSYNITVQNNSNKINGITDYAIMDVDGGNNKFTYTGPTYGWRMS
jgi:VCBS repeat-containing protein